MRRKLQGIKLPRMEPLMFALRSLLNQQLANRLELRRPCRTAGLLLQSGLTPNSIPQDVICRIFDEQREDGGWVGPDDTMWALLYLKLIGEKNSDAYKRGIQWLRKNRSDNTGWGRSPRDIPRIPITGRIIHFLPEMRTARFLQRLEDLWFSERNSLTYKAAFTLMGFKACDYKPRHRNLKEETIAWLVNQQNDDGGFSPWKGHPVGSDIYCTAIALIGLLQEPQNVNPICFRRVSLWMRETQLNNGLWPYHEIEDGSGWGLYAVSLWQRILCAP